MVVHVANESPMEVPIYKESISKQKSYVIVKNHVREITINKQNTEEVLTEKLCHKELKKKKCKTSKFDPESEEIQTTSSASDCDMNITTVDSTDLDELKAVYLKCKEVMNRIERKYGHLLDLESSPGPSSIGIKRPRSDSLQDECRCKINKKIVFDENGQQVEIDNTLNKHICVNKLKKPVSETDIRTENIEIEYQETEVSLPDNLQELNIMLHDPSIDKLTRNKVTERIRLLRQEYLNEIRFNKHILIEKLKSNPDEVFSFKGTNLSAIPGYS